jgi:hypothetical protein
MADQRKIRNYTVGHQTMDWSAAMDHIEANEEEEDPIVHDLKEAGPMHEQMGECYDLWLHGEDKGSSDSHSEALSAMTDYIADEKRREAT